MNTPMILKSKAQNLLHITMYSRKQKVMKTKFIAFNKVFASISKSIYPNQWVLIPILSLDCKRKVTEKNGFT